VAVDRNEMRLFLFFLALTLRLKSRFDKWAFFKPLDKMDGQYSII